MLELTEQDAERIVEDALVKAKDTLMSSPGKAEAILNQLLRCYPEHPLALQLLGICKQRQEKFDESIPLLTKAMGLDPLNPDNYNNLALGYANLDQTEEAIRYLEKAVDLRPQNHLYLNNLALQYRQVGEYDKAFHLFNDALKVSPNAVELWCNLGGVYGEMKQLDTSSSCFEHALNIDPECPAAHVDIAFCKHLQGKWKEGFEHYEWRFKHFKQLGYYLRAYDQTKLWDGQADLNGKRMLLYGEQGLGDMIQFARYVRHLKDRGSYNIVHCANVVNDIMLRIEGVDEIVNRNIIMPNESIPPPGTFPEYDYQCSLMSLPHILKNYEIDGKPYLKPKVTFNIKAQKKYAETFNVGLAWAGSPAHPNDELRSMKLKMFSEIASIPGVQLFNLQVNGSKRVYPQRKKVVDLAEGCDDMRLVDMTPMIQHFDDSATIITGLDLVISVDTALVHLAGALGVPCWVLVPFNPDWRWGIEGETTAWYDSLRLFRQDKRRDWTGVLENVRKELENAVVLSNQR
jgi:tetratricopeptide (TPR) repeat protein